VEEKYGISHGGSKPLVVFRSTDNGGSWDTGTELVCFQDYNRKLFFVYCYLRHIFYDSAENMVYLALTDRVHGEKPSWPSWRKRVTIPNTVKYNPETEHLIAMNGRDLGKLAIRQELIDNGSQAGYGVVRWGTSRVLLLPPEVGRHGHMYTKDGIHIKGYGMAARTSGEVPGKDVVVWTSNDGGKTWDEGEVLVDRQQLGEGVYLTALVRKYQGSGPVVVFETLGGGPTDRFMRRYRARVKYTIEPIELGWRWRPWHLGWNHYNIPERKGKRLYAVDAVGNLL